MIASILVTAGFLAWVTVAPLAVVWLCLRRRPR